MFVLAIDPLGKEGERLYTSVMKARVMTLLKLALLLKKQ